ncbi:hypothetical protein SNE40_006788 [Patella caerulea]|uniref:DUF6589 domain-containing protein n=1 Tax=Patella caerulea TaxID=87958 RepID=A0AAN8PU28_PATCE
MGHTIDYILKVEYLLSPLHRIRALEGAFCNTRGGIGKNVESDLVQEHSVRNQKNLIRHLGSNKSERAITRSTIAAGAVTNIIDQVDESLKLYRPRGKHHKSKSIKDEEIVAKSLRELRPCKIVYLAGNVMVLQTSKRAL